MHEIYEEFTLQRLDGEEGPLQGVGQKGMHVLRICLLHREIEGVHDSQMDLNQGMCWTYA